MAAESDQLALADRLGVGLLLINATGRITAANASAHRLLGARADSLEGKSTMEAFVDHTIEGLVRRAAGQTDTQTDLVIPGEPPRTIVVRGTYCCCIGT